MFIHFIAKGLARRIEHQANMGIGIIRQQFAQHIGDTEDGPGGLAFRIAQWWETVKGTIQKRRTVNED